MSKHLAAAGLLILLSVSGARADCNDPPDPGVNWRRCDVSGQALADIDLTGALLGNGRFDHSDFTGSNFTKVDAEGATFFETTLEGVRFDEARLANASFSRARLTGASFRRAHLKRTRFDNAVLRGADFTGALLIDARFFKADLSGATWIDGTRICREGSIGACR